MTETSESNAPAPAKRRKITKAEYKAMLKQLAEAPKLSPEERARRLDLSHETSPEQQRAREAFDKFILGS